MDESGKAVDMAVIVAKGVVGGIPVIGSLLAEVIGAVIPNQRIDRLEDTMRQFQHMLGEDGVRLFQSKMNDPEFIDLIEEGMLQSARAVSEERRKNIARLLKNGMVDDERSHQIKRRLFEVFERVNDIEVVILMALSRVPYESEEYWDKHASILLPPEEAIGSALDQNEIEAAMMHKAYLRNLVNQGLFRPQKGTLVTSEYSLDDVELTRFGWQMVKYLSE